MLNRKYTPDQLISRSKWMASIATAKHTTNPNEISKLVKALEQLAQGDKKVEIAQPGENNNDHDSEDMDPTVPNALRNKPKDGFDKSNTNRNDYGNSRNNNNGNNRASGNNGNDGSGQGGNGGGK